MIKYLLGTIVGIIIGAIGLGLLIYQSLITPSVGVNVGAIPPIGILYAFIFALGVIVAIAMASLYSTTRPGSR